MKKIVDLLPLSIRRMGNHYDQLRSQYKYHLAYQARHQRLKIFNNIHRNQDCFLIANGPSLNQMDLVPLKHYYIIGLNKIYLIFNRVNLPLSYHVAVNALVIQQSRHQIESLTCPSFLSYQAAHHLQLRGDHIYYLLTKGGEGKFQTNLAKGIFEGATVTYVAMQLAYYLGFKNLYLIGLDHYFKVSGKPHEAQILHGKDKNHFDPHYFTGQKWQLPDLEASRRAYLQAKIAFEKAGCHIYDATVNGKLHLFPKISYSQALKRAKKRP